MTRITILPTQNAERGFWGTITAHTQEGDWTCPTYAAWAHHEAQTSAQ